MRIWWNVARGSDRIFIFARRVTTIRQYTRRDHFLRDTRVRCTRVFQVMISAVLRKYAVHLDLEHSAVRARGGGRGISFNFDSFSTTFSRPAI